MERQGTGGSADFRRGPVSPRSPTTRANENAFENLTVNTAGRTPPLSAKSSPLPGKPLVQPRRSASDVPNTIKLLSELEKSWAMFSSKWKVVDLFGGVQIWQEQQNAQENVSLEPLNSMFFSTATAGLIAFIAASIGGGGVVVAVLLSAAVVFGTVWTMTGTRTKGEVPCFKVLKEIDGSPADVFMYLMNIKNYPTWDASIEKADVIHTIDDHTDIIHIVYHPVWIWPLWVTPRDLCLLRYWRFTEDGCYVISLQSTVHPECPPMHHVVRAKCNGSGLVVAPRTQAGAQPDELSSLVTHVVHMDPIGWEGKLLQRFNYMYAYLRPQVLSLCGLQDVMEARKYVCPNIAEEFASAAAATSDEMAAAQSEDANGVIMAVSGGANVPPLREFPTNVPRAMWTEPDSGTMLVRGPDYLTDRRKIPSAPPAFRLVGVDLFQSNMSVEHIAGRPDNIVQQEIRRHEAEGTEMPFTFIMNFVVPGTPRLNLVLYYQAPHPSVLNDGSPFAELMHDFLDGSDDFRDEHFKLIPCIVEGSFIVRQAVGSTPAIIGKKLRQPYYRGKQYFELDVDIGSSAVANRVVGLVTGYTKKLVIDMGFLVEGQRPEELPERLFGSCRLVHIDLSLAKRLE